MELAIPFFILAGILLGAAATYYWYSYFYVVLGEDNISRQTIQEWNKRKSVLFIAIRLGDLNLSKSEKIYFRSELETHTIAKAFSLWEMIKDQRDRVKDLVRGRGKSKGKPKDAGTILKFIKPEDKNDEV